MKNRRSENINIYIIIARQLEKIKKEYAITTLYADF